jgi:hypothetical protein
MDELLREHLGESYWRLKVNLATKNFAHSLTRSRPLRGEPRLRVLKVYVQTGAVVSKHMHRGWAQESDPPITRGDRGPKGTFILYT